MSRYLQIKPDPDTLYFITDKGLIYRGDSIVVPTSFTTYTPGFVVDQANNRTLTNVAIHVETYGPDGQPDEPEVLDFTVPTVAALTAVYTTIVAAMTTHDGLVASDEVQGHTYLSDATDDTESDVDAGTAATPKAVALALIAAKTYTDNQLAGLGAMRFKGTIGATNGMYADLPNSFAVGDTYGVADAGTYAGYTCSVGDLLVCILASTESGTDQEHWAWLPNDSMGAVTADNTLTQNQLLVGDGNKKAKTLPAGTNGYFLKMVSGKPAYAAHNNVDHGIGPGTCSTAASTAAKTVSMTGYLLKKGGIVCICFTYAVPNNATLNVNSTGAKAIYYRGAPIVKGIINAGDTATFMYDGDNHYVLVALDKNTLANMSEINNDINGLAVCTTAAGTIAKVATLASYVLKTGNIVAVRFSYDVGSSASLNINSTGAMPIMHRNSAIVSGYIRGGDTVTFIYDGTNYHVLAIERPFDTEPTEGSHNLVDSDAVFQAIETATLRWEEI